MLTITKRQARIANAISSRSEMHGDDSVTALDIPLIDILLEPNELNAIMCEPHAYNVLFNTKPDGHFAEPVFKGIKPLQLVEKLEGATVTIVHGVGNESIKLSNVKIAKIKLEPKTGGMTQMSCQVQCTPDLNESVAKLLGRLNSSVEVEIDGGQFGAQQDLPLNQAGANDADAPPIPSGRGRKRANAEARAH